MVGCEVGCCVDESAPTITNIDIRLIKYKNFLIGLNKNRICIVLYNLLRATHTKKRN